MSLEIVSRESWGARPPLTIKYLSTPTEDLWLHHTAGNEHGAAGMRAIQNLHMDVRGWSDIAYSFVVDPQDCRIYEGRGAGIVGGHTKGHNSTSHAICVMGNFDLLTPGDDLIVTIADLVRHGRDSGWWHDLTGGHRDASGASTACPGRNLENQLSKIRLLSLTNEGDLTVADAQAILDGLKAVELRQIELDDDLPENTEDMLNEIRRNTRRAAIAGIAVAAKLGLDVSGFDGVEGTVST